MFRSNKNPKTIQLFKMVRLYEMDKWKIIINIWIIIIKIIWNYGRRYLIVNSWN